MRADPDRVMAGAPQHRVLHHQVTQPDRRVNALPLGSGVVTSPMLPTLLQPDEAGLRRMKRRATGLLLFTAAVLLLTFALPDTTVVSFLRAGAEAGMVGGLADWFAVTALFRHPLAGGGRDRQLDQ